MKEQFDIIIIGAGVVGLAIAQAVTARNLRVALLEKNESFGRETSSRNSEVIHAGIYYPKGFLKSSLCLRGNALLYVPDMRLRTGGSVNLLSRQTTKNVPSWSASN